MYFQSMFEKYMEWKLLQVFLENPDRGFYTKEIMRYTGIGAGTVSTFLRNIQKDTFLIKEIVGNVHLYRLNNELELVKHLKIIQTLLLITQHQLTEQFINKNDTISSIILYGSHANGENDSKSDIDLLFLVSKKTLYTTLVQTMEKKINKQISLQQMTIPEWQTLKKKDKIFYESILEKHIVLFGSGLP